MKQYNFGILRALVTLAAFNCGAWSPKLGYKGQSQTWGSPFFQPKRQKIKGWQKK